MEQLIRTILGKYKAYMGEAAFLQKILLQTEDPAIQKRLMSLELRVAAINACLNQLNEDELFVIQKHLIDKLDWPRVASDYAERWNHEFIRTERSLSTYQTNALKKISVFAQRHKELLLRLFSEGNCEKLE